MKENFGVTVSGVDIGVIEIDKSSEGYSRLMAITQDMTTATVQAQTEANIRNIHDKQRIEAANYEETLRIQREEAQYAQHKQTQTANLGAFQMEKQAEVGVAGAQALGHMGANGAGDVDLGGNAGFNPAAMMAGIAMGGAVGQNIAGMMNSAMSPMSKPVAVPPPVPTSMYHVVVNGEATGPFDMAALRNLAASGKLMSDSYVWTAGMSDWVRAENISELQILLSNNTPPIPPIE